MRLTYCLLAICFMQIISFANADEKVSKFVVNVNAKKKISIKDGDVLRVTVTASNYDGTPFDGKASLYLLYSQRAVSYNSKLRIVEPVNMVNGKAKFDLNITEFNFDFNYYGHSENIQIYAKAEQNLTGATIVGVAETSIYANRYNLDNCLNFYNCENYEADKEFHVPYQLTHVDGSYLDDTASTVTLIFYEKIYTNSFYELEEGPEMQDLSFAFTGYMNHTGFVNFKVKLPHLFQKDGFEHCFVYALKYLDEEGLSKKIKEISYDDSEIWDE